MDWTKYISAIALVISVGSFGLSYNLSRDSAITSIRPVLVFQFDNTNGWSVKNIGNGPALDVIIAMKKGDKDDWTQPLRIPPLAKNGEFNIDKWSFYKTARTLGATYSNIQDKVYSTTCTNDLSKTHEGNVLRTWQDADIERHWDS